jgi:tRNA (pseudouridine54-N1)-methyltransferase
MPNSTKLRFIQILPDVSILGDFFLRDLPGSGKRIDLLCRVLTAAFEWAPVTWPKHDIEVIAIIADSKALHFQFPDEIRVWGEKTWAQIIKESLKGNPPGFVTLDDGNLEQIVNEYTNPPTSKLWVLHEEGEMINFDRMSFAGSDNSFMLGDHKGFNSKAEELISKYALQKVSLGNISYLSSHCVANIIAEFERKVK